MESRYAVRQTGNSQVGGGYHAGVMLGVGESGWDDGGEGADTEAGGG